MQSDNFTQALKDQGLLSPSELEKVWDVNLAVGGPIKKDKLWFFATTRNQGSYVTISNTYFNKNAGDPNAWTYVPDLNHQSEDDSWWKSTSLRTTWQASPRNKVALFWDEQSSCQRCAGGGSPTTVAGGDRAERHPLDASVSSGVDLADLEPRAARSGLLGHGLQLRPRESGEQPRPDSGDATRPVRSPIGR